MASSAQTPLFNWLNERAAGVLLHPTSLPGDQGIGVLDHAADNFLDFLSQAGLSEWQICPLGPTGFGDSPYQCFSAFAGNPYLIDLHALVQAQLLVPADLIPLQSLPRESIDFGRLYELKWPLLFKAHEAWKNSGKCYQPFGAFDDFVEDQKAWLEDYSFFMALKQHFGGIAWWDWPKVARFAEAAKKSKHWKNQEVRNVAEAHAFFQYLFFGQWNRVRHEASQRGIRIIGDAPIFVAADSADVWANPELFQINQSTGRPLKVAGVPPDYFSEDGQLWGNPLYTWEAHEKDGYEWWIERLRANLALCDTVRIDHFRGFDTYWSIPADADTAKTGTWEHGPGLALFESIKAALPNCRLIAEDLGDLAPSVIELRNATGLPGMAILQFAFGGDATNLYLPHNLIANSVVYPGTHDNDTSLGWYRTVDQKTRDHVNRYLRISGQEIGWDLIRSAYASVSALAIVPMQDFLSLGSSARLNTPGKAAGNWQWRFSPEALAELKEGSADYLRELAELSGRLPADEVPN
ncbi:MAG: 4-alpha-glucanotransferase [Synoicihabitans sp.]